MHKIAAVLQMQSTIGWAVLQEIGEPRSIDQCFSSKGFSNYIFQQVVVDLMFVNFNVNRENQNKLRFFEKSDQ